MAQLISIANGARDVTNVEIPRISKTSEPIVAQYYKDSSGNLKTDMYVDPSYINNGWRYQTDYAVTLAFCCVWRPGATAGTSIWPEDQDPMVYFGNSASVGGPFELRIIGLQEGHANYAIFIDGKEIGNGAVGLSGPEGKLNVIVIHKPANSKQIKVFFNDRSREYSFTDELFFSPGGTGGAFRVAGTIATVGSSPASFLYLDVAFWDHIDFTDEQLKSIHQMYVDNYNWVYHR